MQKLQLHQFRLAQQSDRTKHLIVTLYFLFLSLAVRLPFFFKAVFDWDESTYILMGQSVLDGHLPYLDYWELKPPLTFLSYASFIAILGKSIVSVRLGGAICVAVTSIFTYSIGKTLWTPRTGIIAGTFYVFLATLISSGNATMTEHIALVPLMGALSLMVTKGLATRTLFGAGILMGIASLIRLNLAYVTLIIGFFILFVKPRKPIKDIWQRGLAYGAGSGLVIALSYLPYLVTGYQKVWWDSVVLASLSYSNNQVSIINTSRKHLTYILESFLNIKPVTGISILVWLGGIAGLVLLLIQWKNTSPTKRNGLALLIIFLVITIISILKGGGDYPHYLIQVIPFMALVAASFLDFVFSSPVRRLATGAVLLSFLMAIYPSIAEYQNIVSRLQAGQSMNHGSAYEIANYLAQEKAFNEPMYLMKDHIVYWFLDTKCPTKYFHPSIIGKEFLLKIIVGQDASTQKEMAKILDKKPKFVVTEEEVRYLYDQKDARLLLEKTLQEQYRLVKEIQGRQIYRRI